MSVLLLRLMDDNELVRPEDGTQLILISLFFNYYYAFCYYQHQRRA